MAITAAQLVANVSVTGIQEATSSLSGFGSAIGGVALGAGAAAVAIGAQTVKMAGDFQSGMTSLVTGAGESQKNIKMVSDGILKMAGDTGTSTQQLTAGMYMIESAGFHGAAGLDVLKASAQGAKVGNADLGTVANAVTSLMHNYASSGYTATQATNALITTVASGKTHMGDLAGSLASVLPLASSLHIPFSQVGGALATMTNSGMDAQRASMNLAFAIRALNTESSSGSKALTSVGLSAVQVHNDLQSKGLPATLQEIEDHIGKKFPLNSAQGQKALKDILGGAAGLNVGLMLSGTHMKEFEGNVDSVGQALSSKKKDVTGWADVQKDFNQKMDEAKGKLEAVGIKIGTILLPYVQKAVEWVSKIIDNFSKWEDKTHGIEKAIGTAKTALDNIGKAIQSVTNFFHDNSIQAQIVKDLMIGIGVAIATIQIGAFLATLPALIAGFIAWATAAGAAAIATIAASLPIILIGAAIAIVVAGIILAIQHWGEISKWLTGAWKSVQTFFGDLWKDIQKFFGGVGQWFHDRFNEAYKGITDLFKGIGQWFNDRWNDIVNIFKGIGQWFHDRFTEAWNFIVNIFKGVGQWFTDRWNDVVQSVLKFKDSVVQHFTDIQTGAQNIFKNMINGIIGFLNDGITGVQNFINFFGQGINSVAEKLGAGDIIPKVTLGTIPTYAAGTENHPGGPALVGEKGPELVMLPKGTSVLPADQTKGILAYASGTGNPLGDLLSWIGQGVDTVVQNIYKAFNIVIPKMPGDLMKISTDMFNKIKTDVTDWISKLLPSFQAKQEGTGTSASPGTPVNVSGDLMSWILSAIGLTGVPANWANDLAIIAMHESGGNPSAINNWDINAQEGHPSQGIMQTIPSTFAAYAVAGHDNILNPIDNIAAAIGYIKARYGSVFNVPGIVSMASGGPYEGYANGTNNAPGGLAWVGEKGPELMYVPKGASITPNNQINQIQQPVIHVHPAPVYLDGRILATALMQYQVDAIRSNTGYRQ